MFHKRDKCCIVSEDKELRVVNRDLVLKSWIQKDVQLFIILWSNVEWYVERDSFSCPNMSEVFVHRNICQIYGLLSFRAEHNAVELWQILFCCLNARLDWLALLLQAGVIDGLIPDGDGDVGDGNSIRVLHPVHHHHVLPVVLLNGRQAKVEEKDDEKRQLERNLCCAQEECSELHHKTFNLKQQISRKLA